MSIDAVVKAVVVREDGSGKLRLVDRPARAGQQDGIAGQEDLYFEKSPEEVTALNWLPIWGGADAIMLGDRMIARREGYTRINFVDRESFKDAVTTYNHNTRHRS